MDLKKPENLSHKTHLLTDDYFLAKRVAMTISDRRGEAERNKCGGGSGCERKTWFLLREGRAGRDERGAL